MGAKDKQQQPRAGRFKKILFTNSFLCSALALALLFLMLFELPPLQSLEKTAYDLLNGLRHKANTNQVVLIAIDDKSIAEIGSWPWPRSYIADMLKRLQKYQAKAVGLDILYTRNETNTGLAEVQKIRKSLRDKRGRLKKKNYRAIDKKLRIAAYRLDDDLKLKRAIYSGSNIVLPVGLAKTAIPGLSGSETIPGWLQIHTLPVQKHSPGFFILIRNLRNPFEAFQDRFVQAKGLAAPLKSLALAARTLGHTTIIADGDEICRRLPLLINYNDRLFPSLPLQLALLNFKTNLKKLKMVEGYQGFTGITANRLKINTDRQFRMFIDFDRRQKAYAVYSYADMAKGKIPAGQIKNRTVVIGLTARNTFRHLNTPLNENISPAEIMAQCTANLVNNNIITRPGWAWLLEAGVLLYFLLFLTFVIPRVNWKVGLLILAIFLATWLLGTTVLYLGPGYWVQMSGPVVLGGLGFLVIQANNKFSKAEKIDENTETNKMLGLSFQGQGMLDMAFEKFMRCSPKDRSVKDLLYNLGLDFERKRMHNKAVAVYEYILRAGKFKDVKERIKKLNAAEEKVAISPFQPRSDATLMLDSVETKPTLGRYEVIKELGQGAIGTVYLGRDPKINREVAIKVLRYDEVNEEQLVEVKKRFYREAEAAGRLNHPNIVTIYDAGEDYDLTYMAMELLSGENLSGLCRSESLLPPRRVLEIIGSVANALEYAHKNGVIHRDIKPANIMLLADGQVKVADFGIARIVDSCRTHTGDILGTPNYMSPEQVSGKKVDGRSDLFSLGAVMYEMLTGEKPFQSETMAAIMYNIANASYKPIKDFAPDVPDCCVQIVDKLLVKGVTKRFQTAGAAIIKIKECLKQVD